MEDREGRGTPRAGTARFRTPGGACGRADPATGDSSPGYGEDRGRREGVSVPGGRELVERWRDKRERVREYGGKLKTRGFASPFEQMLGDHAELLDKAFSFAVRGMERFVETEGGIPPRYTLCHGRIHPTIS